MEAAHDSIRRARPLLGTFVEVAVAGAPNSEMEAAVDAAFAAVAAVHRLMSFHEADSDVSRLNRDAASGAVRVHEWTCRVLEAALDLNARTAGAFDIAIAPALQKLGLLPAVPASGSPPLWDEGAETPPRPPFHLREVIRLLPQSRVRFADRGVMIDLGGIAKGFAVDRAVDALRRHGMTDGLVNAGGDLSVFGPRRHAVDIRDPCRPTRPLCRVALCNAALASSGGRFDPLHSDQASAPAIVDSVSGRPAHANSGATVCAPDCMIADALTKVVMNAGEGAAALLEHYGASALLVSAQGDIHLTADWKNEVHLAA